MILSLSARLRVLPTALLALLLTACATTADRAPTPPAIVSPAPIAGYAPPVVGSGDILEVLFFAGGSTERSAYRIGTADVLAVDVLDHEDLSRARVLVTPDGAIALPGIGRIPAQGLTVEELSSALGRRYAALQIRNPSVSVAVMEADVRTRGLVNLGGGQGSRPMVITVDEAGTIDLPFIRPIRAGRPLIDIQTDVHGAYQREFGGRLTVTVNLRERAPPQIFVFGEVGHPGGVTYQTPMTPLMAISGAGGFQNTANSADVRLFRLQLDGRYAAQTLTLRRGVNGAVDLSNEVALHPRDILYVPKTGIAVANLWVEQHIRNMLPTNVGFGLGYQFGN